MLRVVCLNSGGAESMVMKFHGNVRGEVRVSSLALFVLKPHIFMCGAFKCQGKTKGQQLKGKIVS